MGEGELRELLDALDLKHHGVIEYDEFLAAALEEQQLVSKWLHVLVLLWCVLREWEQ